MSVTILSVMVVAACSPGEGPESIPLPTSPDTTTTTTSTTIPESGTTTSTTTTTVVPPTYGATIRRTTDGVPHVLADDRDGLFFGQGWASAEDSGCVLVDQVIKIRSERSFNFGPGDEGENVASDFAWKAIGIFELASADFDGAPASVVDTYQAFAAGWNSYLAQAADGLTGWCSDAEWVRPVQPVEVYAYARSLTLLSSSAELAPFIPSAAPPSGDPPAEEPSDGAGGLVNRATREGFESLRPPPGGNGWAVGERRVEDEQGALLAANPHLPWEGELRLGEIHLTVPGDLDVYGAQFVGIPGVGMGFTDGVAWTHTLSAGTRYTAYLVDLQADSPTTYLVDGEPVEMEWTTHSVEILRPDGTLDTETRRFWTTEYGPVIDFPGIGWTEQQVMTFRDANLDNDEAIEQELDLLDAESLGDLVATQRRHQGVPQSNTVAAGANGRVWYGDTSAAPALSEPAERIFRRNLRNDPLTQLAWENGVMILDGSDSRFRWATPPGARDPGLVPWEETPRVSRTDYLFNSGDSYWVPSAEFELSGDYSIVHGRQRVPQSMRTRQSAEVLDRRNRLRLAGPNDRFSGRELRDAVFDNTAQNARLLKEALIDACRDVTTVAVAPLLDAEGEELVPATEVNVKPACRVLNNWEDRYDIDQSGPLVWRETMARFDEEDLTDTGALFQDEFDPDNPTRTPRVPNSNQRPVLRALARAVQVIEIEGFDVDSTLGAAQFTERSGERIALHGSTGRDGVTNVVEWTEEGTSTEPPPERGDQIVPGSDLRAAGYAVNSGTSFVMTVDLSGDTPQAWAILTYGQTIDRESELFAQQTIRFSEKNWRDVAFTEEQILADTNLTEIEVQGD